jgi:hypothetical protein
MKTAMVSRVLSLIPERVARAQSGSNFTLEGSLCRHAERFAHVAKFLQWLTPLEALTKDDQKLLGLLSANGRPMHGGDEEDEDAWDAEAAASSADAPLTPQPVNV